MFLVLLVRDGWVGRIVMGDGWRGEKGGRTKGCRMECLAWSTI